MATQAGHRQHLRPLLATLACVLLTACQHQPATRPQDPGGSIGRVQINRVLYTPWTSIAPHPKGVRPVNRDALGRLVARVTRLRHEPIETSRPLLDGESNILPVGTPLYAINGSPIDLRLAAKHPDGDLTVYEARSAVGARTGRALLPLTGLVSRIEISDDHASTRLAMIDQPDRINRLVLLDVVNPPVPPRGGRPGRGCRSVRDGARPDRARARICSPRPSRRQLTPK